MSRHILMVGIFAACLSGTLKASAAPPVLKGRDAEIASHAQAMFDQGRKIFRYDTFGSEAFWGESLQIHKAIAGANKRRRGARGLSEDRLIRGPQGRRGCAAASSEKQPQGGQGQSR